MNRTLIARVAAPIAAAAAVLTSLAASTPAHADAWHRHLAIVRMHRLEAERRAHIAWHRHLAYMHHHHMHHHWHGY